MRAHRPSAAGAVAAIALTELRRLVRDRTLLFFAVALPVLIITIIGVTFGDPTNIDVGVADHDRSARSADLVASLEQAEGVDVERYGSTDELRRDVRSGSVSAGVVVPAGYGDTIEAGGTAGLDMIAAPSSGAAAAARRTVEAAVADEAAVRAASRFAAAHGVDDRRAAELAARLGDEQPPVAVRRVAVEEDDEVAGLTSFDYTAPSNLVLFVFVNTLAVGTVLALDRQRGITRRMLASPHGTGTILAGIGAAKLLFAVVQSALIVAIGAVAFGVGWGHPVGAALVVLLWAALATAVGLTVGATTSSPDQAQAVGIPVAIGLAMLGGCMWPLEIVPTAMQVIGHLTPHAWAMDAWIALIFDGDGPMDILPQLAALAGFTVVLGTLAAWRLRAALTR